MKNLLIEIVSKQSQLSKTAMFILNHSELFEKYGDKCMVLYNAQIDFDCLKQAEKTDVLLKLGGVWRKSKSGTQFNYNTEIDGVKIRLYNAERPPSCKEVKRLVVHPAQPAKSEWEEEVTEIVCELPSHEAESEVDSETLLADESASTADANSQQPEAATLTPDPEELVGRPGDPTECGDSN